MYRYKRPPRKKKPQATTRPAIVGSGRKCEEASRPATHPAPANDGRKSAIVTVTSKLDRNRHRAAADNNTEASPEVKAFFARMMRPPGS